MKSTWHSSQPAKIACPPACSELQLQSLLPTKAVAPGAPQEKSWSMLGSSVPHTHLCGGSQCNLGEALACTRLWPQPRPPNTHQGGCPGMPWEQPWPMTTSAPVLLPKPQDTCSLHKGAPTQGHAFKTGRVTVSSNS